MKIRTRNKIRLAALLLCLAGTAWGQTAAQPDDFRVRYERARSYAEQLNFAAARAEARGILDDPAAPEYVKAFVFEFLMDLDAADRPHVWVPSVSLGLLHDDNVNIGPSRQSFAAGGASITLAPGSAPKSDSGLDLGASLLHRYLFAEPVAFFGRSAAMMWQSQVSYSGIRYFHEHDFDQDVLTLSTGPAVAAPGRWRAQANLRYDDIRIGGDRLAGFTALNPGMTWLFGATEFSADAEIQRRLYAQQADWGRDSDFRSAGVALRHRFGAREAFSFLGAARAFDEDANAENFSNKGEDALARLSWNAWQGGSVTLAYSVTWATYGAVEPGFGVQRNDRENRTVLGAQHVFREGALAGWSLSASLSHTNNHSNVGIYAYDRTVAEVGVSKNF